MNPKPYSCAASWQLPVIELPAPAFGGVMLTIGNDAHELVFAEYFNRKPHSVVTVEHWDHSARPWFRAGHDKPNGHCPHYFDFNYCRRNGTIYYHNSGAGGELKLRLGTLVQPMNPPACEFWAASGLPLYRDGKTWRRPAKIRGDDELAAMGYRRLKQPRLLRQGGKASRNPFDVAEEGEVVYCRRCDDWLPDDGWSVCEHLRWCDACAAWFYRDDNTANDDDQWICKCEVENED